jgi:hypothetical protein
MTTYNPDKFVVLKFTTPKYTVYKVLGSWGGSYLHGQSWKLNSGVTKVELDGDYYLFSGYSGSVYRCHKSSYGMTSYAMQIYTGFLNDVEKEEGVTLELMPEETNWLELDYGE